VDLAAHTAALEAGGVTTLVLAEGILRFKTKPAIAARLEDGNHLIVSEFPPRLTWSVGNAMRRNATILGLAEAVLIIESGLDGGTFAAGEAALVDHRPLFVVAFPEPPPSAEGNSYFLSRGARPLRLQPDGTPDVTDILTLLGRENVSWPLSSPRSVQRMLFDELPDVG
jgi:predicted Rossmann fold nucleotide-binding protein DprA/Smf involved in DNA uptake